MKKGDAELAKSFYKTFCNGEIRTTNAKTAELVKLTENTFRDINIAFANELSIVCDHLDVNERELIELANQHPRVNILNPGCGVGGHCIAIDPWFIASQSPENSKLIQTARNVNRNKMIWSINLIKDTIKNFETNMGRKPKIGIFGLTFKQDIDDIRESPALLITENLIKDGHDLLVCEPNLEKYSNFKLYPEDETIKKADILVFLVAHSKFKNLDFQNKETIDLCGISKS